MTASVFNSFWWVNGFLWVCIPLELVGLWLLDRRLHRRAHRR